MLMCIKTKLTFDFFYWEMFCFVIIIKSSEKSLLFSKCMQYKRNGYWKWRFFYKIVSSENKVEW